MATPTLSFFNNSCVSSANVEKVVNPPHNPTLRNRITFEFTLYFIAIEDKAPITNAPKIFIINVFRGNPLSVFTYIKPIKYLNTEPRKPPNPTSKHSIKSNFLLISHELHSQFYIYPKASSKVIQKCIP